MTKVTCVYRGPKKKVATYFVIIFWLLVVFLAVFLGVS
jgi:hypothetical protein